MSRSLIREKVPLPDEGEEVIVVCGSSRFKRLIQRCVNELFWKGWKVRSLEFFGKSDKLPMDEETKKFAVDIHEEKIRDDRSDAIFVVNGTVWNDGLDNYIGSHTEEEIELARELGMNVYYFNE